MELARHFAEFTISFNHQRSSPRRATEPIFKYRWSDYNCVRVSSQYAAFQVHVLCHCSTNDSVVIRGIVTLGISLNHVIFVLWGDTFCVTDGTLWVGSNVIAYYHRQYLGLKLLLVILNSSLSYFGRCQNGNSKDVITHKGIRIP